MADNATYDDGYAYSNVLGSGWVLEDVDFRMRVFVDPGPVYPSEVGLKVGRSDVGFFVVEDVPGKRGSGVCVVSGGISSEGGVVHLDATVEWEGVVSFDVSMANSTLYRTVNAVTSYSVSSAQTVNWNVTVDATGGQGFPEVGAGKFISVSIPSDWWNLTASALNEAGGEAPYVLNASGVLLFEATNGTWIVQCGGPNVLSSVSVYSLYDGKEPVEVERAVVGDNLSVRGVLSGSLSGVAYLTVLKDGIPRFSNQTSFSCGSVKVGWNVGVEPGSYVVRLLVECGLEVGMVEKEFTISARAPCSVQVLSYEGVVNIPYPVEVVIYVSRQDTGFPVTGAQVDVYAGGSKLDVEVVDHKNGTYSLKFTPPGEGAYTFNITISGERIFTASATIRVQYGGLAPSFMVALTFMYSYFTGAAQRSQNLSLIGFLVAAVAVSSVAGGRVYRRWRAPVRALSAMENVLVTHKETGLPLWSFDVLSLDVDVALVSGFVSAIKNFGEEMRLGGFNVLETRIGTFVRAESELLDVVCVAERIGRLEVEWLRGRLVEFLRLVEAEAGSALRKWEGGDFTEFSAVFRRAFSDVFNYPKLVKLHEVKMKGLIKERGRLVGKIASIEEESRKVADMFERGVLNAEEYERHVSELSRDKEVLEQRLASIDETLSRIRVRELIITGKVEAVKNRFNEIRTEIDELKKKEEQGELTDKEKRRMRTLERELRKLIEELSKIEEAGG